MIKVSVIIPIYNMSNYLMECLDSVLSQTLKEIEVICVNDGSTDDSLVILKDYELLHGNVIIVNQKNSGVGIARNNGLAIAEGEFVAFMDPDDLYPDTDILECLYDEAKKNEVLICGGSLCTLKGKKVIKNYYGYHKDYRFPGNCKILYKDYQIHYGFTRFIYNLELLKENNITFPDLSRYEDPPFFVKAMICAGEFYAMEKFTYCYRLGHKKVKLSLENTIDYAKGVVELLVISKKYQYKKLHTLVHEAIQNDLSPALYLYISEGNETLKKFVLEINNSIDVTLLQRNQYLQTPFLLDPNSIVEFVNKMREREVIFLRTLHNYKYVIVFGAGKVGTMVMDYLKSVEGIKIICFAVSDKANNPDIINGIPIKEVSDINYELRENSIVLIATYTHLHREIKILLEKHKFNHHLPIDINEFQFFITK